MTEKKSRQTDCSKCNDIGWVPTSYNTYVACECQERKRYQEILKRCGISEEFQKLGFKDFEEWNEQAKQAKKQAIDYYSKFNEIKETANNSIAFLGQIGAGKSRLSIAIANNLMAKNVGVLYMQYREAITQLKQNAMDEEYYQREINRYKKASVLLIDDLYKGKITEADHNIMFEIVNYRYLNMMPMIISSELTVDRLTDGEFEAVGSRIVQRCKGHIIEFTGKDKNFRLR